jgi:hypothetical protein
MLRELIKRRKLIKNNINLNKPRINERPSRINFNKEIGCETGLRLENTKIYNYNDRCF